MNYFYYSKKASSLQNILKMKVCPKIVSVKPPASMINDAYGCSSKCSSECSNKK